MKGVSRGEHIVPEAIGGEVTISEVCPAREVCKQCNTGPLSLIDTELCSRSPLSVIASQQIAAHLWQVWDVDHAENDLLLEAIPDWSSRSLTQLPQIVFLESGPQVRGDLQEMLKFGAAQFERILVRAAVRAFRRHEAKEKRWLHFEQVDPEQIVANGYRFPPRIFSRNPIDQLAIRLTKGKKASFGLRFVSESGKRLALNSLDQWSLDRTSREHAVGIGSELPALCCYYDLVKVVRGIAKIAINLLAAFCPNTPVDRTKFGHVIRMVRGEKAVPIGLLSQAGFVQASDIQPISSPCGGHSFRLVHINETWLVYSSFFGGRVGTFIQFPGPNRESWKCADIVAPLSSSKWRVTPSQILQPIRVRIEQNDPSLIIPSAEVINVQTITRIVRDD